MRNADSKAFHVTWDCGIPALRQHPILYISKNKFVMAKYYQQQVGAAVTCWRQKSDVGRSKLPLAN